MDKTVWSWWIQLFSRCSGVALNVGVLNFCLTLNLLCPRPRRGGGGIRRSSASVVRLSDVAYIGSNSKTKRPKKTKLCTGVPQVTCNSHTDFKVKSQGGAGAYCGGDLAAQLVTVTLLRLMVSQWRGHTVMTTFLLRGHCQTCALSQDKFFCVSTGRHAPAHQEHNAATFLEREIDTRNV